MVRRRLLTSSGARRNRTIRKTRGTSRPSCRDSRRRRAMKTKNRYGDGMGNVYVTPAYPSYVSGKINRPSLADDMGSLRGFVSDARVFDIDLTKVEGCLARIG